MNIFDKILEEYDENGDKDILITQFDTLISEEMVVGKCYIGE